MHCIDCDVPVCTNCWRRPSASAPHPALLLLSLLLPLLLLLLPQTFRWNAGEQVTAVAYDNPIPGFRTRNCINLRLLAAKPIR